MGQGKFRYAGETFLLNESQCYLVFMIIVQGRTLHQGDFVQVKGGK